MTRSLCAVVVWLSILAVATPVSVAEAGPFRDFFHALRSAIAPQKEKPRSQHRRSRKHNETPPSDASDNQTSASPAPATLNRLDVRVAKAVSAGTEQKTDLPYGTPVPGKPGMVTSPFAADKGYVDVTGFPPGTEVQDPYTGQIFRTP
jgi:hypothetical protein